MLKIKPHYGKTATSNRLSWYCRNFNILTTASSRDKCIQRHMEKLKEYGFIGQDARIKTIDRIAMAWCKSPFKD